MRILRCRDCRRCSWEARWAPRPCWPLTRRPASIVANMDTSVKPGDDFFEFVNGTWLKNTEIPPDRSRWGVIDELRELNRQRTADLIKELAAKPAAPGSESRKIADYYSSFLDEAAIEKRGFAPVRPALAQIDAIRDRGQLAHWLGGTVRADVDVLNNTQIETANILGLWVAQDLDNPKRYLPFLLQGGLSMPDRDYYLVKSASMEDARQQFRAHIEAVLKLAGIADARRGRGPRLCARDADRRRARDPHRDRGRRQGQQSLAARGFRQPRARPRLDQVLCRRRTRRAAGIRGLASGCGDRHRRAGRQGSAR